MACGRFAVVFNRFIHVNHDRSICPVYNIHAMCILYCDMSIVHLQKRWPYPRYASHKTLCMYYKTKMYTSQDNSKLLFFHQVATAKYSADVEHSPDFTRYINSLFPYKDLYKFLFHFNQSITIFKIFYIEHVLSYQRNVKLSVRWK